MNSSNVPVHFKLLDDMDIGVFSYLRHDVDVALAGWKMMEVRDSTWDNTECCKVSSEVVHNY